MPPSCSFLWEAWGQCVGGMCLPGSCDKWPLCSEAFAWQQSNPGWPIFFPKRNILWCLLSTATDTTPSHCLNLRAAGGKEGFAHPRQCKRSPHCPTRPRKHWPHVHQKIPFLASFKTKSSLSHYHEHTESSVFLYHSLQCLLCFVLKNRSLLPLYPMPLLC